MKKTFAFILCLVMLLGCVACGGKPADSNNPANPDQTPASNNPGSTTPNDAQGAKKDSISIAMTVDYGTLDSIAMPGTGFDPLICVQESLWECGLDGSITPRLAESWEWPEDDHMVVHLKKGITFSNGNPFTADDVMFTLELHRDTPGAFTPARIQTTDFERTKVRDDYTLDWYLKAPSILHYTVSSQLLIYDKESYNADEQATRPVGTGPYTVTDYVINSHIVLERRDDYWGDAPSMKTITFRILAEPSQRVNAIETGLVDVAAIPLADVDYVSSLPGVITRPRQGSWVYLGFNIASDCALANPEARYAICHAIDTQAISNIVYYARARSMTNPFTPAIVDNTAELQGLGVYEKGYDLELAKQLAESSGLKGKTIVLANNGTAEHVQISEMIQSMLGEIGVTVDIRSYDAASYTDVKNDKTMYDICVSNGVTANYRLGDSFTNSVIYNKIHSVKEDWANDHGERYWEIMYGSLNVMDDAARSKIIAELMEYYVETGPTFGLIEYDAFTAFPEDLNVDSYVDRVMNNYYARDYAYN